MLVNDGKTTRYSLKHVAIPRDNTLNSSKAELPIDLLNVFGYLLVPNATCFISAKIVVELCQGDRAIQASVG